MKFIITLIIASWLVPANAQSGDIVFDLEWEFTVDRDDLADWAAIHRFAKTTDPYVLSIPKFTDRKFTVDRKELIEWAMRWPFDVKSERTPFMIKIRHRLVVPDDLFSDWGAL